MDMGETTKATYKVTANYRHQSCLTAPQSHERLRSSETERDHAAPSTSTVPAGTINRIHHVCRARRSQGKGKGKGKGRHDEGKGGRWATCETV